MPGVSCVDSGDGGGQIPGRQGRSELTFVESCPCIVSPSSALEAASPIADTCAPQAVPRALALPLLAVQQIEQGLLGRRASWQVLALHPQGRYSPALQMSRREVSKVIADQQGVFGSSSIWPLPLPGLPHRIREQKDHRYPVQEPERFRATQASQVGNQFRPTTEASVPRPSKLKFIDLMRSEYFGQPDFQLVPFSSPIFGDDVVEVRRIASSPVMVRKASAYFTRTSTASSREGCGLGSKRGKVCRSRLHQGPYRTRCPMGSNKRPFAFLPD